MPKQLQIVRKASGYYLVIYFGSPETVPDALPGKKSIGLDAGIESFIATPTQLIKREASKSMPLFRRNFFPYKSGSGVSPYSIKKTA